MKNEVNKIEIRNNILHSKAVIALIKNSMNKNPELIAKHRELIKSYNAQLIK